MKNEILKLLKKHDTLPFLFVGSGLSRRYLGLEDWEGLLRKFAKLVNYNEYAYETYYDLAMSESNKDKIFPSIAQLIEKDFNPKWYNNDDFSKSRVLHKEDILNHVSPFKIEIAEYMRSISDKIDNTCFRSEIDILKKLGKKSIGGIITTNYDCFFENIFSDFETYIGQEELIFSPIQGVAEIGHLKKTQSNKNPMISKIYFHDIMGFLF